MIKSEWHYPREAFAKKVFELLIKGPISAISLFSPLRTGKTEFLLNDLAPLANNKKHRVVYVSMRKTDALMASLLYAFDSALREKKLSERIAIATHNFSPKINLKLPGTGTETEFDTASLRGKPQDDHLLLLDQYCAQLTDDKRPTLLLFDEFQELARHNHAAPIIAALRTSLDIRRNGLVSVFTGSSQDGLRRVFSAKEAPFYRFATQMTLPTLDESFVDHQHQVFKSSAKRKIDRADALSVFDKIERNPLFFNRWWTTMIVLSNLTPDSAIGYVLNELGEQFGFDNVWSKLDPLQRALLRLLSEHTEQVYAKSSIKRIATLMSNSPPSNAKIQTAIRRLSRIGVAEKWGDDWRLNDPLFEVWIRGRPDFEFRDGK